MSLGDRTPKKLYQGALSTTATAIYTTPANTRTQITEIWIANTNTTTIRNVTLYAHGLATANILIPLTPIALSGLQMLDNTKIVLLATETIGFKQDIGTDVIVTIYGIEEALV